MGTGTKFSFYEPPGESSLKKNNPSDRINEINVHINAYKPVSSVEHTEQNEFIHHILQQYDMPKLSVCFDLNVRRKKEV